jgi:outer membrane protein assembly factor BamD
MPNKRLSVSLFISFLSILILMSACGKSKEKVRNDNVAAPGRDKELYEEASEALRKGRYDESRLKYNVVVSTYPDSEYLSLSKLAIADAFYLEGGSSNLEQAIVQYRDFVQYFPTHPKACDVYLKIAEAYMQQMGAYNRDVSKARLARAQLRSAKAKCGTNPSMEQVTYNLKQVEQNLALHEDDIAKTYMTRRAYKAAEGRFREIVDNYPSFTFMDSALYMLGVTLIEQEQPDEASQYFSKVVSEYSTSEFAGDAKEFLVKLGKPIPVAANNNPVAQRPGRWEQFRLITGRNNLKINKDGIITNRKGNIDKAEEDKSTSPQTASNNDIQTVREKPRARASEQVEETKPPVTEPLANAAAPTTTPKPGDTPKKKKRKILGIFK